MKKRLIVNPKSKAPTIKSLIVDYNRQVTVNCKFKRKKSVQSVYDTNPVGDIRFADSANWSLSNYTPNNGSSLHIIKNNF